MYDRSRRFLKLTSSTPERVGPGTYHINRTIGKQGCNFAPFLSSQPRNQIHGSKSSLCQPGPTSYNPCTKERTKCFVSMDKGTSRFIKVQPEVFPSLDSLLEKEEDKNVPGKVYPKSSYTGKMLKGAMINKERQRTPVPSIPRPRKEEKFIFALDENREEYLLQPILQNTIEDQKGQLLHDSMRMKRYRGVYFGNRTEARDSVLLKKSEGPGPTDYDVLSKTWEVPVSYTGKKWLAIHQLKDGKYYITLVLKSENMLDTMNSVKKKSYLKDFHPAHLKSDTMRYFDLLIRDAALEDVPAPNYYNITKYSPSPTNKSKAEEVKEEEATLVDNVQRKLLFKRLNAKYETPRLGFNSSCLRFLAKMSETPGPGEYEVSLNNCHLNVEEDSHSGFLQRTQRFQNYIDDTPGPGTYELCGMAYELKSHSRPSCYLPVSWQAPPFGSLVPRSIFLSASKDTPGPGSYNTQDFWTRKHNEMAANFKSRSERCIIPPYATGAQIIRETDLRRGTMQQLQSGRSNLASGLTCRAISVKSASKTEEERRKVEFPDRKLTKMLAGYPFNTSGPRVENLRIPDYPGPGKYGYEDDVSALHIGYSGRMTSQSERFKKSEDAGPGPADYQKVKPEMILKSYNVSIENRGKREKIAHQLKRKRARVVKKEAVGTSKFDNTIAICERTGRVLLMKKPYKVPIQARGKGRHVFLPKNIRTSIR